ncbi:MAG: class I SAM-dependent methyltransferase [Candidatus Thorarchaeota archaeon]
MINNSKQQTKPLVKQTEQVMTLSTETKSDVTNEKALGNSEPGRTESEAKTHHFYDFPKYYDKAFTRDVKSDINFFRRCFQLYSNIEVNSILEPACGPGMFLEALPQFGYTAVGYDLNPAMVDYSKERLRKSGLSNQQANTLVGNMKDMSFEIPFDAAFICINSLGYLRSDEEIISHFKATANSLKNGGIYIVEISCKCNDIKNEKKYDDTWYVKENGLEIELTWAINWYDLKNRIRHVDFQMIVEENGQKSIVNETHNLRLWIYEEFKKLAETGGFELVAIYNQNYTSIPLNSSITGELGALFFVLKKVKNC